jgi:maltose alpha-D-glucosyltransferase/alpha-amylase
VSENREAPIVEAIASLTSEALIAFLQQQRWFAAKGSSPTGARLSSIVIAPWGGGLFALGRVAVTAGGVEHVYQLPLATRAPLPRDVPTSAVLSASPRALYDAVHDSEFRAGLINALATGVTATGDGATWIAEQAHPPRFVVPEDAATRVGSAEQSNTSIIVGDFAILKLFRTLKTGIHPDVEVTRFLTSRAGFANTPALLASMRFEDAVGSATSGMVQTFLPGSSDAWAYALSKAKSYFVGGPREPVNAFLEEAKRLGAVTREMHDALASDDADPAFAPEPATSEDLDRWTDRVTTSVRDSLALLATQLQAPSFLQTRIAEAKALVGRRDHFVAWVEEIADALGDDLGMLVRVHGDYHLGQVLRTTSGIFSVIDFEGEPSRPLDERREKTSPLRDVAGMLRSFAYAAATLAMSTEKSLDMPTRELRSARWERDVRAAYLSGYLGIADDDAPGILPEEAEHVHLLIAIFEAEKAFYELSYELNNRPDWAWIPMRGISKLLTKR